MKNQNWLTLWNDSELRPLTELRRDMERLFDDFWTSPSAVRQLRNETQFAPACDVEEAQDHYLLTVEMPGISRNDVKIEAHGNQLVVSGERRKDKDRAGATSWYSERRYGTFQRSFTLPADVDADRIEAHYEDGVLKLLVPKAETAKPRQIKISEGSGTGFFGKLLNQPKGESSEKARSAS